MLKNIDLDYRHALLVAIPIAFLAHTFGLGDIGQFTAAAIAIIPLAGFIGEATEELAARTGPQIGGVLNATLGNAAELIIAIVAIKAGALELVIASITGSILGNLLLVMGLSILLGGLKNGQQSFDANEATTNATMLILAVVAILVPAIFGEFAERHEALQPFSLTAAILMITIYGLATYYSFTTRFEEDPMSRESVYGDEAEWSVPTAVLVLAIATIIIVFMSELLVESVEHVVAQFGWSEIFIGIIIVPFVGNVAEHLLAVQVAIKNQMNLSFSIALGASLQIALFVAPVLIIVAAIMGQDLSFSFTTFEMVALASAGIVAVFVFKDGKSNWLEGAQLLVLYILLGVAFYFV